MLPSSSFMVLPFILKITRPVFIVLFSAFGVISAIFTVNVMFVFCFTVVVDVVTFNCVIRFPTITVASCALALS